MLIAQGVPSMLVLDFTERASTASKQPVSAPFGSANNFVTLDSFNALEAKFSALQGKVDEFRQNGDSEFLRAVDGRKADKVWKLIDELVEAVKILHPRMYTTFIDKVQDI